MRRSSVSALRRDGRRFQRCELAGVGVKRMRAAEGDGLVAAGVPEGRPERHGDGELAQALGNDFFPAFEGFTGRAEIAHYEGLRSLEDAAEEELGEQAIEAIRRLVEIFDQNDAPAKLRLDRRAAHRGERREIAACQGSLGAPSVRGARRPGEGTDRLVEEERPQALESGGILAELRAHRAVDRRHPLAPPELVEDGRVAVADQELAREPFQLAGEAEKAVSAAREDQRLGVAAKRRLELALAPRVVSGEVAGARKNLLAEAGDEADLPERADAPLEPFALEGAGGSDDVDRIAGTERFHARSVS